MIGGCRLRSTAAAFRSVSISTIRSRGAGRARVPIALGVRGGDLEVTELRIYRDIYYTSSLASTPRYSHGMSTAVKLGADEYFVLGDNSPVSNDSRFWNEVPGRARLDVRGEAVSGSSARPGCSAQGIRSIGVLGSRSAPNPLHSVAGRDAAGSCG